MGDPCIIIVSCQPLQERNGDKFCIHLLILVTIKVWVKQEIEISRGNAIKVFFSVGVVQSILVLGVPWRFLFFGETK